jgi:hypothetical protein
VLCEEKKTEVGPAVDPAGTLRVPPGVGTIKDKDREDRGRGKKAYHKFRL